MIDKVEYLPVEVFLRVSEFRYERSNIPVAPFRVIKRYPAGSKKSRCVRKLRLHV